LARVAQLPLGERAQGFDGTLVESQIEARHASCFRRLSAAGIAD